MSHTVLICDDAIFMRNMIKDIFASGGFEVIGCDYKMPGMDGRQLVEKLRSRPATAGTQSAAPARSAA